MRNAFADELTKLGSNDPRVVLLSGDIGNKLFDKFKASNAGRFINCGIAEANMMGVAGGMALSGLRPVVYTITPFTTTRCFEQIRVDACYHNVPVIIVGTGSGLSYAELGPTHHSCEDLAIMRVLPHMTVMAPADEVELRQCLRAALKQDGPVYIRIGKRGEAIVPKQNDHFEIGRSITVRQGADVCLVGTGTLMPTVLEAAELLAGKGIEARVESFHTIKPLDEDTLRQAFSAYGVVAVVEEHSRLGGLGGSIAEWLAQQEPLKGRLLSFGVDDVFMHEIGTQEYARARFGLTADNIAAKVAAAHRKMVS
ncbi:putative transketolase [Herbaspirillum sp. GW103]|jgi:transketolase|uniref:transketolase family protein n=1 Tax=Herbaspirillum sp. GW103 TaxID=1175306 RepID=UPI00025E2A86|nr:transketolase C-terminal domain-containing protein [Herbaspirillum sp. GW103]EIJ48589.1 putative transketolase [Herbaspirillum sp. GW103]